MSVYSRSTGQLPFIPLPECGVDDSEMSGASFELLADPIPNNRRDAGESSMFSTLDRVPEQLVRSNSFPAGAFGVRSHMTANPYPSLSLANGHYVSEPYDTSENPPPESIFISDLETLHPITRTIPRSTSLPSSAMNTQQNPDNYGYNPLLHNLHYIPIDYTEFPHFRLTSDFSSQQNMPEEYQNDLYLPASPLPYADDSSPPFSSSSASYSVAPAVQNDLRVPITYTPYNSSEIKSQPSWGSQFNDSGMNSPSELYDFSVGYAPLQGPRSTDSHFHLPDPQYVSAAVDAGLTRLNDVPKKQTLACHFCRERKIACGRPVPGSLESTCNQCARRNLICTYPTESRRGQHKRKMQKPRDLRLAP
ncbi:hypothetical protein BDP27DRAFT_1312201 [Rhodocollybia butyracea]|uniref:Zn(2)-C6 fungal-type domain-containing protein n=1 Tax=Rhodocollybia butyracea TaxID=206335 RepID=A0A9P5Q9U1_9AGAR|nr:hypothetical protein BDP27DRAFT_1312201 [Rhodocollybia butyracea]